MGPFSLMMSCKIKYILPVLTLLLGSFESLVLARGVEASQLEVVAIDSTIGCSRIFFRSTQHFANTIFMMPRVIPGGGNEGGQTVFIESAINQPGKYYLTVRLYFPINDEVRKDKAASSAVRDSYGCNLDQVKSAINQRITDPHQKIKTISNIPLTAIDIAIPGLSEKGYIGNRPSKTVEAKSGNLDSENEEESDILDYYGKSLSTQILIDESEKQRFESNLVSPDGVTAKIRFHFKARVRNGALTVEVDSSNLEANFMAGIKGKTMITPAELQLTLKNAVNKQSVRISGEESNSGSLDGSYEKISDKIIDRILETLKDLGGRSTGGVSAGAADAPAKSSKENSTDPALLSVSTVVEVMRRSLESEIRLERMTAPESATLMTEVRLKASRLNTSNVVEVPVHAGYQDPSTGIEIRRGYTFSISPKVEFLEILKYEPVKKYLTTGELLQLNLAEHFPDIVSLKVNIADQDVNGNVMALGKVYPFGSNWKVHLPATYRWVRTERFPVRVKTKIHKISPTLAAFSQLPVFLIFSKVAETNGWKIEDLLKPNDYLFAKFDEAKGQLVITAKKDLGTLQFKENMKGSDNIDVSPIVLDEVSQEKQNSFWGQISSAPVVLRSDSEALTKQRTIIYVVTKPYILKESN